MSALSRARGKSMESVHRKSTIHTEKSTSNVSPGECALSPNLLSFSPMKVSSRQPSPRSRNKIMEVLNGYSIKQLDDNLKNTTDEELRAMLKEILKQRAKDFVQGGKLDTHYLFHHCLFSCSHIHRYSFGFNF